ncbi:MAG: DUF359 domain-containing protein [Nitrososphaeria archaeon]|nr:DUF359 domain-containing protein [Nitrososphaeria archaeon]
MGSGMEPTRSESPKREWPIKGKLIFPEKARELLRKPAGRLLRGGPEKNLEEIKRLIIEERPALVIAVGDYTSEMLRRGGIPVSLYIVDGRVERRYVEFFKPEGMKVIRAVNEPGTLNPEAVAKLHELLQEKDLKNTVLFIEGEEDILTLAAMLSAPDRSLVIYGQPGEGSVIVIIDSVARKIAWKILSLAVET